MKHNKLSHLAEFRRRLIYALLGFILCFLALIHFANHLYFTLATPLLKHLPATLIATDVIAPFFVPLKLTAIVAFVINLPNCIFQIWQFVAPGLYKKEKSLFLVITIGSLCLFLLGIAFCYFLVIPAILNFISHIKAHNINVMADIGLYLDLNLKLFMVFGLCFETPIIIWCLIYFNWVKLHILQKFRRYMLVLAFIIGAILAPPDVLSQVLLAVPLYLLYELGMLFAKFSQHTRFKHRNR